MGDRRVRMAQIAQSITLAFKAEDLVLETHLSLAVQSMSDYVLILPIFLYGNGEVEF